MRPLFVCSTVRLARLSQNKIICAYPFPIAGSPKFRLHLTPQLAPSTAKYFVEPCYGRITTNTVTEQRNRVERVDQRLLQIRIGIVQLQSVFPRWCL